MSVELAGRRTRGGRWRWLIAPFSLRGLSGFALWGFFLLSVLATGLGFADLRAAGTEAGDLSAPELAITVATTLFVVCAMVVALHNMLEPHRAWWVRFAAFVFYLLLAVWTVGLATVSSGRRWPDRNSPRKQLVAVTGEMAGAVEHVSGAASAAETATREAADTATARAQQEAAEGRTCANRPSSTPGEGPLMRSRFAFADRARSLSAELRQNWIDPIAGPGATLRLQADARSRGVISAAAKSQTPDEQALPGKLARGPQLPSAERRALFTSVHEDARTFAAKANDLRALHAEAFATRLTQLAAEVGPDPRRRGSLIRRAQPIPVIAGMSYCTSA